MCWRFIQKTYRYNKINEHTGCQSLPVRYGFRLPSQIYPLIICHQSHRSGAGHVTALIYILQGSRAYRSGTGLQLPSYTHRFPLYFVTNSHRSSTGHVTTQIYILQGSRAYRSGTGYSYPRTHRFPHYFVTNSHRSGPGHVTTQTRGPSRSGTGYSCPYRFSH